MVRARGRMHSIYMPGIMKHMLRNEALFIQSHVPHGPRGSFKTMEMVFIVVISLSAVCFTY